MGPRPLEMKIAVFKDTAAKAGIPVMNAFIQSIKNENYIVCKNNERKHIPQEYQIRDTSYRVLNLIVGTAKLSNMWYGINQKH